MGTRPAIALSQLVLFCASAQHMHQPSASQPAKVLTGLGNNHHVVSTSNAEAQRFFDQGLALIYAFNHEAAAQAFQRAAELDPKLAMAWWGYALAVGPNYNEPQIDPARMKAAVEAVEKAKALSGSASDAERGYINALAARFTLAPNPDGKQLGTAYSNAMRTVYERNIEDPDAAVLYADSLMNVQPWQLWGKAGEPLGNTEEIVRVLEGALKRWPEHVGANHLYIHSVEASRTPDRASASVGKLGKLAPGAGHLVHMPSHIYLRRASMKPRRGVTRKQPPPIGRTSRRTARRACTRRCTTATICTSWRSHTAAPATTNRRSPPRCNSKRT
jgi:tetratricopeptide (TPR) repeat protein